MHKENRLGTEPLGKLVVCMAMPSMLAQFVSVLYSIVDRIYVGNIPKIGELSLAGVGLCGPVVTLISAFAFLIGIGGSTLMGIRLGEGNQKEAERILSNCFSMLVTVAIGVVALVLPLRKSMLYFFGASDTTYPYANAYFTVYLCGSVFALISAGMNQFIISQGHPKEGMISVIIGAGLDIILDPLFIFVFDMQVSGAALASVISQAASAAYVIWFLSGKRSAVQLRFGGIQKKIALRVIKIGFTPFIIIALDNVMIISMNALLQKYGGAERGDALITCNTIVQSFMLVMTMPLGGISGGTQGILSYNYGAGRFDRIKGAQRYIMLLCACYTLLMFIFARTGAGLFIRLFTTDQVLTELARRAIEICTLAGIPLGIQYAIVDGFTGMGQVQYSLPLSMFRKIVYFISIFSLPVFFDVTSVFYAEPISDVLGPIVSVSMYFFRQ